MQCQIPEQNVAGQCSLNCVLKFQVDCACFTEKERERQNKTSAVTIGVRVSND